jgi:hypothetical protein
MKATPSWQVTRSVSVRSDAARRWDYAYQFLLQWAMETEADTLPAPSAPAQEEEHGNRPVCPRLDHPSATGSDD